MATILQQKIIKQGETALLSIGILDSNGTPIDMTDTTNVKVKAQLFFQQTPQINPPYWSYPAEVGNGAITLPALNTPSNEKHIVALEITAAQSKMWAVGDYYFVFKVYLTTGGETEPKEVEYKATLPTLKVQSGLMKDTQFV